MKRLLIVLALVMLLGACDEAPVTYVDRGPVVVQGPPGPVLSVQDTTTHN